MKTKKLLFICSGNICRSPLAHKMFEKLALDKNRAEEFNVDSCGTGAWHEGQNADTRMRAIAKEHGWILDKKARKLQVNDFENFDYLYVMDDSHIRDIKQLLPLHKQQLLSKVHFLREYDPQANEDKTVPDPYYNGIHAFHEVYAMIERSCNKLLEIL